MCLLHKDGSSLFCNTGGEETLPLVTVWIFGKHMSGRDESVDWTNDRWT